MKVNQVVPYTQKEIFCVDTDTVYKNAKDAATDLNLEKSAILAVCKFINKSTQGYHFLFNEDYEEIKDTYDFELYLRWVESDKRRHPDTHFRKRVICLETKHVYESLTEVCNELGVSRAAVNKTCSCKIPSLKGLHFKYVG